MNGSFQLSALDWAARAELVRVLRLSRGHKGKTSEQLRVPKATMYRYLKRWQVDSEEYKDLGDSPMFRLFVKVVRDE